MVALLVSIRTTSEATFSDNSSSFSASQRWNGGSAFRPIKSSSSSAFGPGVDAIEPDLVEQERLRAIEDRIDRIDEPAFRTPVSREGKLRPVALRGRFHVGENIRAAEGVDRLFRIADERHRRTAPVVNAREDRILHRIGVLEFSIKAA